MGGFCEVLQGSNSLARGFVVVSGTQELVRTMGGPAFASVFRRIAVTTSLGALSVEDVQAFFCNFIRDFVPGCLVEELQKWSAQFIREGSPWGRGRVSIDMVKQFLMQQISSFRAHCLSDQVLGPNVPCRVPHEKWDAFAECLTPEKISCHYVPEPMQRWL